MEKVTMRNDANGTMLGVLRPGEHLLRGES
jgi:hypothetical protein